MRVLMLSWEYPPHVVGGVGKHVADLVPALAAAGVEVHVVTPRLGGGLAEEQIVPNATVYRAQLPGMSREGYGLVEFTQMVNSRLEERAWRLHQQLGGFDLIHAHEWQVGYSAVGLKYAGRAPLAVTMHGTERGRGQGFLAGEQSRAIDSTEWRLTYEAWKVITVSRYMVDQIHSYFALPLDKIDAIPNGINFPDRVPISEDQRQAFRRGYAGDDEKIVFTVGRMVYEKGIQFLIDAAPSILAREPSTRFIVAGTGSYLDALQQRAMEQGVHERFSFTGYISDQDRDRLYLVADVAVFPSVYEPFGIVALEAMATGCPVVVSATGGLAEVVTHGETGLACNPGSADSLAWAILEILEHPDRARVRAQAARRAVIENYQWSRIADRTKELYRRIVHERAQSDWAPPELRHTQIYDHAGSESERDGSDGVAPMAEDSPIKERHRER